MRIPTSLAVVAFVALAGVAQAQEPMNPYETQAVEEAPQPAPATDVQQPINPYAYPSPPAYGYQPPTPGLPAPEPPAYQQGYYLYPGPGQAPVYYAPPPRLTCAQLCA